MLKLTTTCLLGLIALPVFSQVDINMKLGYNLSSQRDQNREHYFSDQYEYKGLHGGHGGFGFNVFINSNWSVQTELIVTTKGSKEINRIGHMKTTEYNYMTYIQYPLHLRYSFQLKNKAFYVYAGPYRATAIKSTRYGQTNGALHDLYTLHDKLGNSFDCDYTKEDFGLDLGLGLNMGKRLSIVLSYGIGLKNINPDLYSDVTIKNRNLGFSLVHRFRVYQKNLKTNVDE